MSCRPFEGTHGHGQAGTAHGLCAATFEGGEITGSHGNPGVLSIRGGNLATSEAECRGIINAGDPVVFGADYDIDPDHTLNSD